MPLRAQSPVSPVETPQEPLRFEQISSTDGLSQNSVRSILQDSRGFLWFGTEDGLNKYDGYSFSIYRHDPDDPNSLSRSMIRSIYEDRDGVLWLGTDGGGLSRFERDTGEFMRYRADSNTDGLSSDYVRTTLQDRNGALWIGTNGGGLSRFDPDTEEFKNFHYNPSDPNSLSNGFVLAIYEDRDGALWVGTDGGGLNRFDRNTGKFIRYQHDPDDPHSLSSNAIRSIYEDRDGRFWIGTDDGGLNRFDRATGQAVHYRHDPDDPYSLSDDSVSAIHQDRDGTIWIGTFGGGLNVLDLESEPGQARFVRHQNDLDNAHSLSNDFIWSILEDQMGVLWIGTHGGGINKLNPLAKPFTHYQVKPNNEDSLSNDLVWAIYEDQQGILWVGTNGGGLDRFDRSTGQVTHYRNDPNEPNSLGNDVVRVIHQDEGGAFWLGMDDGKVDRFDAFAERFEHYQLDTAEETLAIHQDGEKRLWVGTSGGGLHWFNEGKDRFDYYRPAFCTSPCLNTEYIRDIYEDQDGVLWLGTFGGGLNRFEPAKKRAAFYFRDEADPRSLSSNTLLSIHQDQAGILWLGTHGGGLERFDPKTETFTHYQVQDGLPSDVVYGILQDDQGHLWLSTNHGLSRFDPQTEAFRNYDASDGLQSNEFNGGAYFQSQSGEMFFGGVNGFNAFYPDQVEDNRQAPPVVVTAFKKFNQTVLSDLAPDGRIRLPYKDNFVSFEFAALDYAAPEQNEFAYKMEGLDRNWIYPGTRRHADYPDLKPGKYIFRVKGSNSDGIWSEEETKVHITITPPFWATWWFRGAVLLVLMAGVLVTHRLRVRSIKAQSRELAILVEQRTAELRREVDHRIQAEEALRENEMEKAVIAERSRLARDLHDAVSQTLFSASLIAEAVPQSWERDQEEGRQLLKELRQLTQGALAEMRTLLLELRPAALVETDLGDLMQQLAQVASAREDLPITVNVEGHGSLPPDVHIALYRIAQEALNNVVKHSRSSQVTITLRFIPLNSAATIRVELSVRDDGRGFDLAAVLPERLGLGIMRERAESVGAQLMIESAAGQGTSIRVVWDNEPERATR